MSLSFMVTDVTLPIQASTRGRTRVLGGLSKRIIDIVIAASALIILCPLLFAVALAIKSTMGGRVIFGHRRVGKDGQPFRCLKFRSMAHNSEQILASYLAGNPEAAREWQAARKLKDDPRITPLGRVLRAYSIDELPQFLNVLAGQMSCVGPRPIMFDELHRYGAEAGDYLRVKPGLTGLWQISGRSSISYEERVALDVAYVRGWSLRGDVTIMMKTLPAVARIGHTS